MYSTSADNQKMDNLYSWFVCFAIFMVEFILMGFYTAFGTVFIALINEFKASETSAAWIGSLSYSVCVLGSLLVNTLLSRGVSYRTVSCIGSIMFGSGMLLSSLATSLPVLYFTYGFLVGIGSGLVHYAGILVIPRFFRSKRGLAFGIALSGHGIGALPMGYILEILIERFDLRIAFRLMSLFAIPLFAVSLIYGPKTVLRHSRSEDDKSNNIKVHKSSGSIWKNKALIAHAFSMWMYAFGYYIPSVHLVNMAEGLGVPAVQATFLPSSIAISQSVGKILFGQIAVWYRGTKCVYFCQVTMFICGIVTTLCPLMANFNGLLSYTIIYGLFDACSSVFTLKIIEDVVGEKQLDTGYAFQMVGMAFFMLIGPPVAGFLYESTGSYQIPFIMSGGFATLCVCIMFLTPILRKQQAEHDFSFEFSRKISLLSQKSNDSSDSKSSSSSKDSGIGLPIDLDIGTCSSLSSKSSFSVDTLDFLAIDMDCQNEISKCELDKNIYNTENCESKIDIIYTTLEKEYFKQYGSPMIITERETVL